MSCVFFSAARKGRDGRIHGLIATTKATQTRKNQLRALSILGLLVPSVSIQSRLHSNAFLRDDFQSDPRRRASPAPLPLRTELVPQSRMAALQKSGYQGRLAGSGPDAAPRTASAAWRRRPSPLNDN